MNPSLHFSLSLQFLATSEREKDAIKRSRGRGKEKGRLTDAVIGDSFADASLEEAGTTVATVDAVVLAVRLVAADLTVHGDGKRASHPPLNHTHRLP